MRLPDVVSRGEWRAARTRLLAEEKALIPDSRPRRRRAPSTQRPAAILQP